MDDRHIRSWIRFACERNEVSELAQVVVIEWNPRFTRRLGDAGYSSTTFRARIRLSIPLWSRSTEEDRRETVIHETCHLIVGFKFGQVTAPHGSQWQEAMRNCGLRPTRLHSVDRSGLARRQKRFILLACPRQELERKCRCTTREFNLLRRGKEFWCKVCGLHLDREAAVEEDR